MAYISSVSEFIVTPKKMVLYLIQFNRTMVREETFLRKNPLYRDNDCRGTKPVTLNSGHNEILFYILLVPYFYFTLIRPGKKKNVRNSNSEEP